MTALALPRTAALVAFALLASACAEAPPDSSASVGGAQAGGADSAAGDAQARAIVDSARAAAGAAVLEDGARVTFGFRGARFRLDRPGGAFSYTRSYRDSLGRRVEEVLTTDTLRRRVEGQPVSLTDAERRAAETAVNSVAYFALLPFSLDDPAVQPRYTGVDTVGGAAYHRVEVTFRQQGGGRDWQDRFLYWFDRRDYSMDYLAYAFGLGGEEEAGTRFREAFNVRRPGGVRVADYRNYTADSLRPSNLERYGHLFDADSLRLFSTVALDSVSVQPLDD